MVYSRWVYFLSFQYPVRKGETEGELIVGSVQESLNGGIISKRMVGYF